MWLLLWEKGKEEWLCGAFTFDNRTRVQVQQERVDEVSRDEAPSKHTAEIKKRTEASNPQEGACAATGSSLKHDCAAGEKEQIYSRRVPLIGTKIIMAVFVKKN